MLIVSSWGIIYDNNLLWYGQQRENAHIEMKINTSNVEKTSFIYVLEKFDTTTTIEDVIALMGSDYVESNDNGYTMRYETSRYTLNGKQSSFISFTFNRRKTEIFKITWLYKDPPSEMFSQTLQYLETNAFGKADSFSTNKADWTGLHLEDTSYYLLLQRIF